MRYPMLISSPYNISTFIFYVISFICLSSCAMRSELDTVALERGRLPTSNISVNIPGLGPCTDNPDRSLSFNTTQPINILVHGCFSSSGAFRSLAQVLAFQGQQSACFTYDDRNKLTKSADQLKHALKQLAEQSHVPLITVIGHSQGALIARKSLTDSHANTLPKDPVNLRLVTISGPFAGIESAKTCGRSWLYPLTLGFVPFGCYLITGEKWNDITHYSSFIRKPGALAPQVDNYLKIDTDERNSCRYKNAERCIEDDEVFSLAEQNNELIQADSRIHRIVVKAGHVEIVGDKHVTPTKLISLLQENGVLLPTLPEQSQEFSILLSDLYR